MPPVRDIGTAECRGRRCCAVGRHAETDDQVSWYGNVRGNREVSKRADVEDFMGCWRRGKGAITVAYTTAFERRHLGRSSRAVVHVDDTVAVDILCGDISDSVTV